MDITTRYNQEKETTIQYDITELLHDDLSDYVKHKLERSNEDEVKKFLSISAYFSSANQRNKKITKCNKEMFSCRNL